jgi:hypothetical protein
VTPVVVEVEDIKEVEKEVEEKEEMKDEEKKEEKEEEKEICNWIMPLPSNTDTMNLWFEDLEQGKLNKEPFMVFESVTRITKPYEIAKKEWTDHLTELEKFTTVGYGLPGLAPSCQLAFMCHSNQDFLVVGAVLLEAGYTVDTPLLGIRKPLKKEPEKMVYMFTAKKSRTRKRLHVVGDHWKKQFPESSLHVLQYNAEMALPLEEQVAIWFLACNTRPEDEVWQFNAQNFPFFSKAAIAMGLDVTCLHTEGTKGADRKKLAETKLVKEYLERKDSFRGYDDDAQRTLAILALSTQKWTTRMSEFFLNTRFRKQHGESIQSMHKDLLLNKLGLVGYVETSFANDKELVEHLSKMYRHMQRCQDELDVTTIRMKRLRYFAPSPEDIAAGEDPLSQQEVKKTNFLSYHHIVSSYHNYHHQIIRISFILDRFHDKTRLDRGLRSSVPRCERVGQRSTGDWIRPPEEWALWTTLPSRQYIKAAATAVVTPRLSLSLLLRSGSDSRFSYNCMLVIMY